MTLAPVWRNRLQIAAAAALAVVLGDQIADGTLVWAKILAGVTVALVIAAGQSRPLAAVLLGAVAAGYIVGNRGFAQVSVAGALPLFPAELVLAITGCMLLAQSAARRELPVRRDLLNGLLLLWMAVASVRLYFDLRTFGAMALRDYATVYYAAFFFISQAAGGSEAGRRFLRGSLEAGCVILMLIYPLYLEFPAFFLGDLTFQGVPVIFFKGDLAGTFLAAGSVLFFQKFEERRSGWTLVTSLLFAACVAATNSRASMLGLAAVAGLRALSGRRLLLWALGGAGLAAAIALAANAEFRRESWRDTILQDAYEHAVSIVDPLGEHAYSGEATAAKGDNNAFRTFWWRICIDDTLQNGPWTGLGWGYDLAAPFERVYYPEGGEDFSARSPHDIFITLFARTGTVGLLPFLAFVAILLVRTVRSVHRGDEGAGAWGAACVILTSACFGVVLEGPMGAVVFWITLGLASASSAASASSTAPAPATEPAPLPARQLRDQG